MSTGVNLTGRWVGHYLQHDRPHSISMDLVQTGSQLTGLMWDQETATERSLFEVVAEAGLPPGADEQILAGLHEIFPEAPSTSIRYVTQLPPDSVLEGWVNGQTVYFLKRYQGTHFSGYKVGERLVGTQIPNHEVHYSGQLHPDGAAIEGQWWIDPELDGATRRAEGAFVLCKEKKEKKGQVS